MAVTLTAGWMKLFSSDPHLGFISAARDFQVKIAAAAQPAQLATWHSQMVNSWIDAGVTAFFLAMVLLIVGACGRIWWLSLVKQTEVGILDEEPYVSLSGDPAIS